MPSRTSALGRAPATSARPPDLAKGAASLAAYRIFISTSVRVSQNVRARESLALPALSSKPSPGRGSSTSMSVMSPLCQRLLAGVILYAVALGDEHREGVGAGQLLVLGDVDVLCRYDVLTLQFGSTTVSCIRTQFLTTAPFLIFAAAEQHAVLNGALDDAAVSQQAVLDRTALR